MRKTAVFAHELEGSKIADQDDLDQIVIDVRPTNALFSDINFDTHGKKDVNPFVFSGAD